MGRRTYIITESDNGHYWFGYIEGGISTAIHHDLNMLIDELNGNELHREEFLEEARRYVQDNKEYFDGLTPEVEVDEDSLATKPC